MKYDNTVKGIFLERPNRFIAYCEIRGRTELCHVKNTGRCKELLVKGAMVILQEFSDTARKTKFDIIAVYKNGKLINMDSAAPNKAAWEFIPELLGGVDYLKPEYVFGSSRIDFYAEKSGEKYLIEVKGCTLEQDGVCLFPDAPTERGLKHVIELTSAKKLGYHSIILIVIQIDNVKYFTPNYATHFQFGTALKTAAEQGVEVIAVKCRVTENSMVIDGFVPVELENRL